MANDPKRKRKAQSSKRKTKGVKENRQDRITLDKAERARLDQIISEYEQQNTTGGSQHGISKAQ